MWAGKLNAVIVNEITERKTQHTVGEATVDPREAADYVVVGGAVRVVMLSHLRPCHRGTEPP